jgi:chemotaxis protein methyltransferase CheR
MITTQFTLPSRPKLEEKDFNRISEYIQQHFGIKLPIAKLILVESRLIKRVVQLQLKNFTEYVNFVFSADGNAEQNALIDHISTNKTDFFREDVHFKFIENHFRVNKAAKSVKIWSAACSSGEEPYSISMVFEEMLAAKTFAGTHSILGTDISNTILGKAMLGEYAEKTIAPVPKELLAKYFICKDGKATVKAALRKAVSFKRFNLIDNAQYHSLKTKFDFIFCRNVLIYFDHATQTKVIDNLIKQLNPGGYLFLGHSETLMSKNAAVTQIQPTIYQKNNA